VPMPFEKQVAILYAGVNGLIDDIPVDAVRKFETDFLGFLDRRHPEVLTTIREKKIFDDALKAQLESAVKEFKTVFKA
jgi:F-type H+/Na+-transporting ATPase subunit alpha